MEGLGWPGRAGLVLEELGWYCSTSPRESGEEAVTNEWEVVRLTTDHWSVTASSRLSRGAPRGTKPGSLRYQTSQGDEEAVTDQC
jgi:hypothetical protein